MPPKKKLVTWKMVPWKLPPMLFLLLADDVASSFPEITATPPQRSGLWLLNAPHPGF